MCRIRYPYRDEQGRLLFEVVRHSKSKTFSICDANAGAVNHGENEEGETIRALPDFVDSIKALSDQLAPFLKTQNTAGPHAETLAEFHKEQKLFAEDVGRFQFTDLKGSTELAEQKGEIYSQQVRHQHDAMLRQIVERDNGGRCIKNIGDALMCIFAEPSTAVERAVEIQEKLAEFNRAHADEAPVRARIGMHMGQVVVEQRVHTDVFGRHVNRAARLESLSQPGRILVTEPVYDSAAGWLAEKGLHWADHGYYRLKGISEPVRVYEVCTPSNPNPTRPRGDRVGSKTKPLLLSLAVLVLLVGLGVVWFVRHKRPWSPSLTCASCATIRRLCPGKRPHRCGPTTGFKS